MFWTGRVEYYGRIFIVVGVVIRRLLRRFYVIFPASIAAIVIIVDIFIIFSRDLLLVCLVIFWFCIRYFMLYSIKEFQSDGGSQCNPPGQLTNVSGEQ